jgi:cyclase
VHRTLIVAKFDPADAAQVAKIFEESDAGGLPGMVGARSRTLFSFHDLYFHLVEAEEDIGPNLYRVRSHPLFRDVNTKLAEFIRPYDPGWREPKDAMANVFYEWEQPDAGSAR